MAALQHGLGLAMPAHVTSPPTWPMVNEALLWRAASHASQHRRLSTCAPLIALALGGADHPTNAVHHGLAYAGSSHMCDVCETGTRWPIPPDVWCRAAYIAC